MSIKSKNIIRISGGLGNQMFQYAAGLAISLHNNAEFLLDLSFFKKCDFGDTKRDFYLNNFNISGNIAKDSDIAGIGLPNMTKKDILSKSKRKLFRITEYFKPIYRKKIIIEPYFHFCPDILKIKKNCYLSGVWQSEKYFKNIKNIIRKEFTLKNEPNIELTNWIKIINKYNSISLHIRRGDYINSQKTNQFHGVCSLSYYYSAIEKILSRVTNPYFFIFSDDIDWAKNNLKIKSPAIFAGGNGIADYEELILISKCKHNIIANSSFSWWGAWLNENKDQIVISPKEWFNVKNINTSDLIPERWIII